MTNLSLELREKLKQNYGMHNFNILRKQESTDGTIKYLFDVLDGNAIETVLMSYHHGYSICVSTQIGCKMGCKFCASTGIKFVRNLTSGEIVEQILAVERDNNIRISNVVFMGIGEPLDNYENFVRFVRLLSDEKGLHISQRNITISTCGIVPNMKRLAEEGLQITLALSLHGSTQEKRQVLMPIANKYQLEDVLEACDYYFEKTGRRITFEYSLVHGVNDRDEDAEELITILKHRNCHINLIPVNPIKERDFQKPSRKSAENFKNKLEKNAINVTIRREMGSDIDGACGQLRRRYVEKK
jgi:23S rRNA (adenine2503-C2)-methyltransferase